MANNKRVFAKFTGEEILLENGRILYALLFTFASRGYRIELLDSFSTSKLDEYGELALKLDGVEVVDREPQSTQDYLYLYDRGERWFGRRRWKKAVQVRFDLFSRFRFSDPIFFPYPMHPVHCGRGMLDKVDELRRLPKKVRVLFSGDTKGYKRNRITVPGPKLTRSEIVEHIKGSLGDHLLLIEDSAALDQMVAGTERIDQCVIVDSGKTWIDDRYWLQLLAGVDFFIAPPGYVMPMCHNITEAMAVGAIPITNYPEWPTPRLESGRNCLSFESLDDLDRQLELALGMSDAEVAGMQSEVMAYYDHHLSPASFLQRLEQDPRERLPLLIYTEGNVARRHKQQKRSAALLRG